MEEKMVMQEFWTQIGLNLDDWHEMFEVIPKLQKAVMKGYERHSKIRKIGYQNNSKNIPTESIQAEITMFNNAFDVFQSKHSLQLIIVLSSIEKPYFSQIKESLANINPTTLTRRLKMLEEQKIIKREVNKNRPIRVFYELTDFGWGICSLLYPLLIYFCFPNKIGK